MLQGPRVVAIVSELEPTGVAKHVWVDRKWHLGGFADALDEAVETDGADWPAAWRLPLAGLVAFSHLQFQIRGRQPYLIVRNILYVI